MDTSSDSANLAHISLYAANLPPAAFPERRMTLDATNNSFIIGRASKTSSKGFLADKDNGWFESAVMSRKHAEIKIDVKTMKVKIEDLGSLHGTYINDEEDKIASNDPRELRDGDIVRFGVSVWRASESFSPTKVRVGIAFDHRSERASSTFRVPEDSDMESELECYSNNGDYEENDTELTIIKAGKRVSETIDLTEQGPMDLNNMAISPVEPLSGICTNNAIDLSSPLQSPVVIEDDYESDDDSVFEVRDVPVSVAKATVVLEAVQPEIIEDDIDDEDDMDQASFLSEQISSLCSDDEQQSMHYDSDEASDIDFDSDAENESSTSSLASNEAAPYGMDDEPSSDVYGFDDESSSVDGSEEDEEDPDRCIGELDDTSDEDEPTDPFWKAQAAEPHIFFSLPKQGISLSAAPDMPMRATLPPTIGSLLNNDDSEIREPAAHSTGNSGFENQALEPNTQRHPSPSDIIMSKSFHKATDTSEARAGADLLAQKSGKRDYFEAREENKISLQKKAGTLSSVHSLCNEDHPVNRQIGLVDSTTSSGAATAAADHPFKLPHLSSHFGPLNLLATEAAVVSASPQVPKEPVQEAASEPMIVPANDNETAPASVAAQPSDQQPKMAANGADVSRRTRLGISDIVDSCQKTLDECKVKRKAKNISTLSEEDEAWVAREKPVQAKVTVPISPAPSPVFERAPAREASPVSIEVAKADIKLPAPPQMSLKTIAPGSEARAPKRRRLRKIAERVGYAALGGVTAGAMIVGTLIYTAPTF
ncbi:hypothetical protein B0T16DRAFT_81427 [Cercophora newfieldiana]|uniref:FHA domain-containing protein n=1 Tax=Cercophora newfieldiana TaxID=92897 RepID=A0AA40CU19_9PEZI|nr:hypothetical protein B0T16DRAFT_81427 [Cercophora newfieldiana]